MRPLRYLLFTYDDVSAIAPAMQNIPPDLGLHLCVQGASYSLFVSDAADTLLFQSGVVVGKLFRRHGPAEKMVSLSEQEAASIRSSNGKELIERFWGSYIAVIADDQREAAVLRDPSGGLPSYYVSMSAFTAYASDPALLVDVGLLTRAIDWDAFVRYLYLPDLPSTRTAIVGLRELMPGTASHGPSNNKRETVLWSPWDHVAPSEDRTTAAAAERLERTVRHCSRAWGTCYDSVLVGVSGGLDSSIVVASLSHKRAELTCITLVADDPAGDEREYARILSNAFGAELLEVPYLLSNIDIDRAVGQHLPRPGARTQALAYDAQILAALNDRSIQAFFTGNGGDNVFFLSRSARAIVDRFIAEGFGSHLAGTLGDICTLTGCSLTRAVGEAIKVYRSSAGNYRWPIDRTYLSPTAVPSDIEKQLHHPWLEAPAGALPGKKAHIAMLLRMQNHLEGYDRRWAPPVVNPLTSQPVVELCLQIPSWMACKDGRDRSVAREAFSKHLPQAIVERRTKGGPDGFAAQILSEHREAIKERLLDGVLASNHLLDRAAIERDLRPSRGDHGLSFVRLLLLVDAEAWANCWRNGRVHDHTQAAIAAAPSTSRRPQEEMPFGANGALRHGQGHGTV